LALFFAPLDRCPDVAPLPRGASGFAPLPFVPRKLSLRAMAKLLRGDARKRHSACRQRRREPVRTQRTLDANQACVDHNLHRRYRMREPRGGLVENGADVIVEGIDDLQTIEAVERAVTSAVERAGPVGRCTVAVAPTRDRDRWRVGVICSTRRDFVTVHVAAADGQALPDALARTVETSLDDARPPSRALACPRCGTPLQPVSESSDGRLRVGNPPRPLHVAAASRCPVCGSCGTAAGR
jgi:hypothetical protein